MDTVSCLVAQAHRRDFKSKYPADLDRFCTKILKKRDWKHHLQNINFSLLYNFLDWYLGQRTGRNGRWKRPVRSRGSLVTFWCCFRLAFQRAANWKINMRVEPGLVHNVCWSLIHLLYPSQPKMNILRWITSLPSHFFLLLLMTSIAGVSSTRFNNMTGSYLVG